MHCSGIVKWDGRYVFLKPHQGKDGAERKSTRSPRSEVTHTWPSPPISIQRLICVWAAVCTKTPPRRGLRETWRFHATYPMTRRNSQFPSCRLTVQVDSRTLGRFPVLTYA